MWLLVQIPSSVDLEHSGDFTASFQQNNCFWVLHLCWPISHWETSWLILYANSHGRSRWEGSRDVSDIIILKLLSNFSVKTIDRESYVCTPMAAIKSVSSIPQIFHEIFCGFHSMCICIPFWNELCNLTLHIWIDYPVSPLSLCFHHWFSQTFFLVKSDLSSFFSKIVSFFDLFLLSSVFATKDEVYILCFKS